MHVSELMEKHVSTCRPEENLEAVARRMKAEDIGALPVIDDTGHPIGMITDRDIVLAIAETGEGPMAMHAGDIGLKKVTTVRPQHDVEEAIARMRASAVRRLPVVDKDGEIMGMVSLGDLIDKCRDDNGEWQISPKELESMLAAVTAHH